MNERFNYTYVAPTIEERNEIESIKRQYLTPDKTETKLDKLRRLDRVVKTPATVISLSVGIIGLLIFGLGLAMVLEFKIILWGVIVSVFGVAVLAPAYSIYIKLLNIGKKKYGEEIIKLSNELLNEEK